jgi:hypothetical protein
MPGGKGFLTIAGVGDETDYYGAEALVTQQIKTLTWEIEDVYADLLDESLTGSNAQITPEAGVTDITGAWSCIMTYTEQHLLLMHFFGTYNGTAKRYTIASSIEGTGLTWAIDKVNSVATAYGVKINQLVFNVAPGWITLSGTAIAQTLIRNSALNTAAVLAALAPDLNVRAKYTDTTFRLGVSTALLTAANDIDISEATITFTRQMAQTHVAGTRGIYEPDEDGFFDIALSLTFPRYLTDQYKTWAAAKTPLTLRMFCDAEGTSDSLELLLPGVTISDAPTPVSGPGFIPQTITALGRVYQHSYGPVTTLSAAAADNSINDSANAIPVVYPGATVRVSGFTGASTTANGVRTVVSRTASKLVLSGGAALIDDAAGESVTLQFREPLATLTET